MPSPDLRFRIRFPHGGPEAFGPGKAELLGYIAATGSLRTAAAEMGLSYQRAWILVRQMNDLFRRPLVTLARGGETGGGASLTPLGEEVLARYRRMEAACRTAAGPEWRVLRDLLR